MSAAAGWRSLRPLFLDFEASGVLGWPVEVGWADIRGGEVVAEGHLIRPEPDWDPAEWDEEAEAVHGIALARLRREGAPARDVAARAAAALRGRVAAAPPPRIIGPEPARAGPEGGVGTCGSGTSP
jgi:hypothetical protein